jgi:hypothetical protein
MLWVGFLGAAAVIWLHCWRRRRRLAEQLRQQGDALAAPLLGAGSSSSLAEGAADTAPGVREGSASDLRAAGALAPAGLLPRRRRKPLMPHLQPAAASWFQAGLLLPPLLLAGDIACTSRLVGLWGLEPDAQHWPSWCLLAFLLLPHVAVALILHVRLVATAVLLPSPDMPVSADQPAGASLALRGYAFLVRAPAWLAYPLLLVLLLPAAAVLTLAGPLTLLLHLLGQVSFAATRRYLALLQACAALTQAPATAALLTVLYLLGNVPNWDAFLDGSLFFLTVLAAMVDMLCALWVQLRALPPPDARPAAGAAVC